MEEQKFERIRNIPVAEGNRLLKKLKWLGLKEIRYGYVPDAKYRTKHEAMASDEYTSLMGCFLISGTQSKLLVTTNYWRTKGEKWAKACTWAIDLNGLISAKESQGFRIYGQFNKIAKIKKLEDQPYNKLEKDQQGKYICSAKPILGYAGNDKLHVINNCYEYDLNSAYSSVILKGIPDLDHPCGFNRKVGKDEVGFVNNLNLDLCSKGDLADIIFPLIPCPDDLKAYIMRWYRRKAKAKTKEEKEMAKAYLNFPIGYSQRTNPYFRAYVVGECNKVINKLLFKYDGYCVIWNTDAIITTKPIKLDLGLDIGEWKCDEIHELRYIATTYQIDDALPKYRGVVKSWFSNFAKINRRPWKLGVDPVPSHLNAFEMDWKNYRIGEKTL